MHKHHYYGVLFFGQPGRGTMLDFVQATRKPVDYSCIRVTEANMSEVADWCKGKIHTSNDRLFIAVPVTNPKAPRQAKAYVGDWVITDGRYWKIYTNKAYHDGFNVTIEKPCGRTSDTVDNRPCVLGVGHKSVDAVGCRSLTDYIIMSARLAPRHHEPKRHVG